MRVEGKQPLINAGRVDTYQLIMRSDVITSSGKNLFITNGLVCDQLYKRWVESGSELDTPSLQSAAKHFTPDCRFLLAFNWRTPSLVKSPPV